jgi:hypothetical protein
MAIGTFVVQALNSLMNPSTPGAKYPAPTPTPIAAKIHNVR